MRGDVGTALRDPVGRTRKKFKFKIRDKTNQNQVRVLVNHVKIGLPEFLLHALRAENKKPFFPSVTVLKVGDGRVC